MMFVEAP